MRVASLVVPLSFTLAAVFGQPVAFNQFTTLIPSGQFQTSAETGDLDLSADAVRPYFRHPQSERIAGWSDPGERR